MTKWSVIRGQKVPREQEGSASASVKALGDALRLNEIRASRGLTQTQLAEVLGKSQGNVSELERRDDVYLSSLREYIEALGGELEVAAVFDGERRAIAI